MRRSFGDSLETAPDDDPEGCRPRAGHESARPEFIGSRETGFGTQTPWSRFGQEEFYCPSSDGIERNLGNHGSAARRSNVRFNRA